MLQGDNQGGADMEQGCWGYFKGKMIIMKFLHKKLAHRFYWTVLNHIAKISQEKLNKQKK